MLAGARERCQLRLRPKSQRAEADADLGGRAGARPRQTVTHGFVGVRPAALPQGELRAVRRQQQLRARRPPISLSKLPERTQGLDERLIRHFADATADDLPTNIRGMRAFLNACVAKPLPADDFETALCWNIVVPARIRANLAAREIDGDDVLRALNVPLPVTQGRADSVVLPAMAEHVLAACPTAEASWYEGVGHLPHLQEPERFNRELAALTRRVRA